MSKTGISLLTCLHYLVFPPASYDYTYAIYSIKFTIFYSCLYYLRNNKDQILQMHS